MSCSKAHHNGIFMQGHKAMVSVPSSAAVNVMTQSLCPCSIMIKRKVCEILIKCAILIVRSKIRLHENMEHEVMQGFFFDIFYCIIDFLGC